MSKRTDSPGQGSGPRSGLGSLASGALTAASMLVVAGVAAAVGVVIAREFGRSDETDGLLAAYGAFTVIVIAAQALRVTMLPALARARQQAHLAGEIAGSSLALLAVALPLIVVAELGAEPLARLLTGNESEVARDTCAEALRWMVPAAVAHLFAAVAASGLAALDDYGTAALGYAAGSMAGLLLILTRVDSDGIIAVAWGSALNGAVSLLVPATVLAVRSARERMPRTAVRPVGARLRSRLGTFAVGASLPIALQVLYVVCLPFAARLESGAATSFVYGYLAASSLVAVTASSLGLVSSVPLARGELSPASVARHVAAASWLSLAAVAAVSGALVVAGAHVVEAVLGASYGGDVGAEIGWLVVLLAPWMVASVGISLAFPLVFIVERTTWLPLIAAGAVVAQVPLAFAGSAIYGLEGLAVSLGITTWAILAALLRQLHVLSATLRALVGAAALLAGLSALSFVPTDLLLEPYAAAALGLVVYCVLLAVLRPRGLVESWRYLRALA